MSPRIRTFTVRTIEKIIRLSTRTSVDKIIDSTYSDEKTHNKPSHLNLYYVYHRKNPLDSAPGQM